MMVLSLALVLMLVGAGAPTLASTDADGDGYVEGTDCDDTDPDVWTVPGATDHFKSLDGAHFIWDAPVDLGGTPSSVRYDTLRSSSPSDFSTAPPATCQDPEGLATSTTDTAVPAPGHAFFYLARARNSCGDGSLGTRSNGMPRSGMTCDCSALCNDGQACTLDRCADGVCAHDPIAAVILDQPESVAVCPGESASLRVRAGAAGLGPATYQWKKNGVNVGTNSSVLTLSGLGLADDGAQITCVVTTGCTPTTSASAVVTVFPSAASCGGGGNGFESLHGSSNVVVLGDMNDMGFVAPYGIAGSPFILDGTRSHDDGSIHLFSGEFHLEDTDLVIAGRGFDFVWGRNYRSREGVLTEMGQNWDFTYDRRVVAGAGGTLIVYGGTNRHDTYAPGPTGCWTSPGWFRDICPQLDGTFLMTFPNRTTWRFAALDGSPAQGRILSVSDSDANQMTFTYSSSGRLDSITDTMGRPITVSYNPDGYISSLTDFGGRAVTYDYYSAADEHGMPGDLESVTSPHVTGAPNGNDFPAGKTTTYTYTKNTGQPALDHNLLTVRRSFSVDNNDPPVVTVRNTYTATTNPASPRFDRMDRQVFGDDPSTSVAYVYMQAMPGDEPPAVTMTIVRDRDGNVGEAYFDASNRFVTVKQYTGRAQSRTLPTTKTTNRPIGSLRAADPPYFRTHVSHNAESLITEITLPKLDSVTFTYDSANPDVKLRANLLQRVRFPGPAGGDQPSLTESWDYGPTFGSEPCACLGCCGEGDGSKRRIEGDHWVLRDDDDDFRVTDRRVNDFYSGPDPAAQVPILLRRVNDFYSGPDFTAVGNPVLLRTAGGGPRSGWSSWTDISSYSLSSLRGSRGLQSRTGEYIGDASTLPFVASRNGSGIQGSDGHAKIIIDRDTGRSKGLVLLDPWGNPYHYLHRTDANGRTWSQTLDPVTGNLLQRTAPTVTIGVPGGGGPGGGAQLISESWEYNSFGQIVQHIDPLGHITQATYYTSGAEAGYLESVTVDAPGPVPGSTLALLTVTARDQYGNLTQITDARGNTETFVYNQLDQVVHHVDKAPFSYVTDYRYDAGDRLVQIAEENRDETGALRARPHVTTVIGHDPLNRPAYRVHDGRGSQDPNGGLSLRTEFVYDGGGRLTLTRLPEAVSGHQPNNVLRTLYDERGFVYRLIDGEGDPAAVTTQYDYDADGGLTAVRLSPDEAPRSTIIVRDGYGRAVQAADATENVATAHYDAAGHVTSARLDGELVDGSSGPNVRLAEAFMTHDEVGRMVQVDRAFFDTQTGMPIGDGVSTTKTLYDERSQVVRIEDDDGNGPDLAYDGARRLSSSHDPAGNTVEYAYDENGNVVTVTETEVSDSPGTPPQVFVTTNVYDALDSMLSTSQAGVAHSFVWDSQRFGPVVTLGGRNNETRADYDAVGRLVATHRKMTDTGTGSGTVTSVLDETRTYDRSSRLTSQTDDKGNTTSYTYDPVGRLVATANADYWTETEVFNKHDDLVSSTDPNGTVTTATHDDLGRVVTRTISRAPGVLGTTSETWKHDGMSRIVSAQNNDALVTQSYDSMSHLTRETSVIGSDPGRNINWVFTGSGLLTSVTYPSGHNLGMTHDTSGRIKTITSSGPGVCSGGPPPHPFCTSPAECGGGACVPMSPVTATYDYLGPERIVRTVNGNGTETVVSFDDLRRPTSRMLRRNQDSIDDFRLTWDDDSNKTSRSVLLPVGSGSIHDYGYDSASRLVQSAETRPGLPSVTIDYVLDGASNRTSVTGGPDAGSYSMSSLLPEPADHQMNQYSLTPLDGARTYDRSGNLVSRASGAATMSYDYRGRLVLVSGSLGSGSYSYDPFGRRVLADGKRLYYDGVQEIEERAPTGSLTRVSVNCVFHGKPVIADFNADGVPDRVFLHPDDLGNVVVATDSLGNALEYYDYGDYGRPRFKTAGGSSIPQSAIGNPFLFGGQRYDSSTGLYDFRTRHLDPRAGRFVSRDTLGTWGDPNALGNATAYAGSNPWSSTDPLGMSQQTRAELKEKFQEGDIPTGTDFANLIDSFLNFEDDGLTSYRATGKVKWFNDTKGFGFAKRPPRVKVSWGTLAARLCPGHISCPDFPSYAASPGNEVGVEELRFTHEGCIKK